MARAGYAESREGAEQGDGLPGELDRRRLKRRAIQAVIAFTVIFAIALLAPGLGQVRDLLGRADPVWLLAALALEGLSFASYVVMFRPIFCRGMKWRRSWQIGGSELAMGSLVPASGAGGLALGAWILHGAGMEARRIARRSVAFLLIKSSVNFVAVIVVGTAMWLGVGPHRSVWLTAVPAIAAFVFLLFVFSLARLPPGEPKESESGPRRWWAETRAALVTGTDEAIMILRGHDLAVIGGAIGYWVFDNAVIWATFKAFGLSPPVTIILMGYLIGQLGGLLPIPGGIGGIDGGLIGTFIVYGVTAAGAAAAVLAYRVILFWLPLIVGGIAFADLRRNMPGPQELASCAPAYSPSAAPSTSPSSS
jgi:uncharacterized membrane protein YbhN (UPF0104 family)